MPKKSTPKKSDVKKDTEGKPGSQGKKKSTRGKTSRKEKSSEVSKDEQTGISHEQGSSSPPSDGKFKKGDPRINRTQPGPGRPKNSFRKKCRRMINTPKSWRSVRRIMKNDKHPLFGMMWKELAAHGHGKAPQVILTPTNPNPENTARFIHEMLEEMDEKTTGEK